MLFVSTFSFGTIADESNLPNTIYVDDDNTEGPWDGSTEHPYQFIQDGIDIASYGDTVFVFSGIYYENLVVEKSICLIGENRDTTIIEWGGEYYVICINNEDISISGFTIKNSVQNPFHSGLVTFEDNITIRDNIFINNEYAGIYLSKSNNSIVDNNIFLQNGKGILLEYAEYTTIKNNHILNNKYGIDLYYSTNNSFIDNNLKNNGFFLANSYQNEFKNNSINEKPFICMTNTKNKIIDDAGQVILYKCKNITMQNLNLSSATIGLKLDNSDNCRIISSKLNYNLYGIICRYADYNFIEFNEIESNTISGLYLYQSILNHISNNTIDYNKQDSVNFVYSWGNTIINNSIQSQDHITGIDIYYSSYINVINNEIKYSQYAGIALSENCNYNEIIGNNIDNNQYRGIKIRGGHNNSIIENILRENNFSIEMSGEDLRFIHNNVINNTWGIRFTNISKCNISYNNIFNTLRHGIFIDDSEEIFVKRNFIKKNWGTIFLIRSNKVVITENNFVDSQVNIHFLKSNFLYKKPFQVSWDGNYWDNWPYVTPKPILGIKFLPLMLPIIQLPIPIFVINFDINPSPEPFNCSWNGY